MSGRALWGHVISSSLTCAPRHVREQFDVQILLKAVPGVVADHKLKISIQKHKSQINYCITVPVNSDDWVIHRIASTKPLELQPCKVLYSYTCFAYSKK